MELNVDREKESISRSQMLLIQRDRLFYLVKVSYMLTDSVGPDQHYLDVLVGLGFYCLHMSQEYI